MISRRIILKSLSAAFAAIVLKSCNSRSADPVAPRKIKIGKYTEFTAPVTPRTLERVVIRRDQQGFSAMSLVCSHQECLIPVGNNLDTEDLLVCPCHGSKFNARGEVLSGPASKDLTFYQLELDNAGDLWVHLNSTVSANWRLPHA